MATLTITVPNAVVPRIQAAFGHANPAGPDWIPATIAEVQDALKNVIKDQVTNYEAAQADAAKRIATRTEAAAW